jgi:3-hydroxybutyryl-CoA dehydrogenase
VVIPVSDEQQRYYSAKKVLKFIIAHFFAPAHIIPLVEIVPEAQTPLETVSFTTHLMERVGKSPVVMKQFGLGFIVNRIQKAIGETVLG